nr:EOG090X047D [Eulimnadia texana]
MSHKAVLVVLLGCAAASLAVPVAPEAEERSFKPSFSVNPFFGYNKYKVVRYNPALLPPPPVVPGPSYGAQAPSYSAPAAPSQSYGAPAAPSPSYGTPAAPAASYSAPAAPSYSAAAAPSQAYAAPAQSYGAPAAPSPSYGAPAALAHPTVPQLPLLHLTVLPRPLLTGVLRINPKNYKEAYITSPDGTADILINDLKHRNRALNGDIVVVKIIGNEVEDDQQKKPSKVDTPSKLRPVKEQNETKVRNTAKEKAETTRKGKQMPKQRISEKKEKKKSESTAEDFVAGTAVNDKETAVNAKKGEDQKNVVKQEVEEVKGKTSLVEEEDVANGNAEALATEDVIVEKKRRRRRPKKKSPNGFNGNLSVDESAEGKVAEEEVAVKKVVDKQLAVKKVAEQKVVAKKVAKDKKVAAAQKQTTESAKPNNAVNSVALEKASTPKKQKILNKFRNTPNVSQRENEAEKAEELLCEKLAAVSVRATPKAKPVKEKTENTPKSGKKRAVSGNLKQNDNSSASVSDTAENRKTGKVVFIKEYKHSRITVGSLKPWDLSSNPVKGDFTWALFSPKDHRVPRLKVMLKGQQREFLQKPDYLYVARIVKWEDVKYPLGELGCELGQSGDLEVETIRILTEHDVDYKPHENSALKSLPQLPWSIPAEEMASRRDYRDACIFTIDPPDARDLDDAVFGEYLGLADDGVTKLYRVSVHIADVSYFLTEGSPLDEIAASRATSTYLVDRVIPMLPSVLCEHLCSLNPGEDRLAFSVEWTMNDRGEILDEWFGRSVIRSCAKLSYDHAQAIIENRDNVSWPAITAPHTLDDIRRSVLLLQDIATCLRAERFKQGALRIDLPRLHFVMDWETRQPLGCRIYELKDSNRLIEELMLLANTRVAMKLYSSFPEVAVLRSHPPPQLRMLQQLSNNLAAVGIHLDTSSSAALQASMWKLIQSSQNNDLPTYARYLVVSNMLAKPMKCAQYICSGVIKNEDHFRHYALSVPLYTHFTSPIRRYADVLVHRLLSAALGHNSVSHWKPGDIKKLVDNCNDRKLAAKGVQELHTTLHFGALLKRCGPVDAKAVVQTVLDRSVDVIIIHLGLAKRIYLDKLPLAEMRYEQVNGVGTITLVWNPDENGFQLTQNVTQFTILDVEQNGMKTGQKPLWVTWRS